MELNVVIHPISVVGIILFVFVFAGI